MIELMYESEDTIHLELDREDAPQVIELIVKMRDEIDEEIEKRQAELKALMNKSMRLGFMLERLDGPTATAAELAEELVGKPVGPLVINGYNASWTLWEKIQYVLRKQIDPISKTQIIAAIETFDHRVAALTGKKKRAFSVSVSSTLTTKSQKGMLNRVESETEDNKYYLPKQPENE